MIFWVSQHLRHVGDVSWLVPPADRTRNAASARATVYTVGLAGCSRVYDAEALAPCAALQSQRQRCEPPERGLSPGLIGGQALAPRTV